jgi:hypothetical protein
MGLIALYEKGAGDKGWFGPGFAQVEKDTEIGEILAYNESQERVLVAKTKDATPIYYYVLVTVYRDGNMPDRLRGSVMKDRAIAQLVVVAPKKMETKMTFVNVDDMSKAIVEAGTSLSTASTSITIKTLCGPIPSPPSRKLRNF